MSERDLVGLLPSFLRLLGQKGSFTSPGQSQHRLRFHRPQLLHRWGTLEPDAAGPVKRLPVGRTGERGWRRTKVPLFHATATPGVK